MAKKYADMTQEEREEEARDYVESQKPVVPEDATTLNEFGHNVPEPKAAPAKPKK